VGEFATVLSRSNAEAGCGAAAQSGVRIDEAIIEKRSRKLSKKIVPLFLTREAAMLRIWSGYAARYAGRVTSVGYWKRTRAATSGGSPDELLRNGGRELAQTEFSISCAELLHVLHDYSGPYHMDSAEINRNHGARRSGFVFDSVRAVTSGKNISGNPLLADAL